MGHGDLNFWKNKDGNYFHAIWSNKTYDISAACNTAVAGSDFEVMVFHTDGEPVGGYQDADVCECCDILALTDTVVSLQKLYDDPGEEWYRKKQKKFLTGQFEVGIIQA